MPRQVEMSADLVILKPRDATKGNGIALFDVVNRGRGVALSKFDAQAGATGGAARTSTATDSCSTVATPSCRSAGIRCASRGCDTGGAAGRRRRDRTGSRDLHSTSTNAEATVGDLVGYTPSDPAAVKTR
jgi:hypothetical protein